MPVGRERDRHIPRDEQRVLEEVRRLLERYRMTGRHGTAVAQHDQRVKSPGKGRALTLR